MEEWKTSFHATLEMKGLLPHNFVLESILESKANNMKDSGKPVFPTDRFSFMIIASMIGNWQLNDAAFPPSEFCCNLRLKPKAVRAQWNLLQNRGLDDFITGLHIGKVELGKQIGEKGQDFIGEITSEQRVLPRRHETGPVNSIGFPI